MFDKVLNIHLIYTMNSCYVFYKYSQCILAVKISISRRVYDDHIWAIVQQLFWNLRVRGKVSKRWLDHLYKSM